MQKFMFLIFMILGAGAGVAQAQCNPELTRCGYNDLPLSYADKTMITYRDTPIVNMQGEVISNKGLRGKVVEKGFWGDEATVELHDGRRCEFDKEGLFGGVRKILGYAHSRRFHKQVARFFAKDIISCDDGASYALGSISAIEIPEDEFEEFVHMNAQYGSNSAKFLPIGEKYDWGSYVLEIDQKK